MKKFIISLGLAAAGTASLEAAYAPGLNSMEASKFWSVSGTLRGFYDDNYNTSLKKEGSAGFELSPSVSFNVPLQQTELGLRYTYGLYYYQERRNQGNDPYDQSHQVDLWVDHAFSERWQATVHDTLAIGQEPTLLTPGGGATAEPYRVEGNNIVNSGEVTLTTDWTRLFSTVLTYDNDFYDYQQNGGNAAAPSQAGLLNRIDESVALDLQWSIAPETIALVGYKFEWVDFTGNEQIAENTSVIPNVFYSSNIHNNYSDIVYVGLQRAFLPNLNVSAKVGVQDTDEYNDTDPSFVTPYAVATASYTYAPGSYVQLGVTHQQNATYVIAPGSNGKVTQSQQSTVISASVNHAITAELTGSIIGLIQLSTFNQGAFNNGNEDLYSLGLNLNYAFNQHLSAEVGYNLDDLQTVVTGTGYSRNRVYVGVSAAY